MKTEGKSYRCILSMHGNGKVHFTKGKIYINVNPEIWPTPSAKWCLVDDEGENHFLTIGTFMRFFRVVKTPPTN